MHMHTDGWRVSKQLKVDFLFVIRRKPVLRGRNSLLSKQECCANQ